uniref:Uncharacterized protein n=1 Tax=Sphaerodactylus townsendi TaxID=933632 RepID=A0ACB8FSP7_9SAUR
MYSLVQFFIAHIPSNSYESSPGCGKKRKVSLLFDHLDAGQLANHLSYLEFKAFCRISYLDFQSYVLHGSVHGSPALERSIALCNSISQWVQVMILSRPTIQQRAEVFTKFICVTQLSLDLYYTDEEIYTLSYAREPRYPKSLPATQFKPPVVMEWAPRMAPKADRTTIRKHVQQLVESVFKNYDPEQRGYISQEDFETISTSFPFSFYGLERDREGPWNREELLEYFMRACAIFSKLFLANSNFHGD